MTQTFRPTALILAALLMASTWIPTLTVPARSAPLTELATTAPDSALVLM